VCGLAGAALYHVHLVNNASAPSFRCAARYAPWVNAVTQSPLFWPSELDAFRRFETVHLRLMMSVDHD